MNFRADINALRAVAVLSVVFFHFFPNALPGGFSGVDVFFVISGYLMTAIILKGIEWGDFSVLDFYLARARRILPALTVLSIFLLFYGWFFLLPTDYKELSKHVAASLTFISNVIYWREAGYFAAGAHEKWLLHTWSLSVEWQFYIAYPLVLLFFKKIFGYERLHLLLYVMLLLSFVLSLYMSFSYADQAYYMFYTRAWQMLAGALVFIFPAGLGPGKLLNALGYLAIFSGFIVTSHNTPWPGYMSVLPVLGACLVIYSNKQGAAINHSVIQWFGTTSYSIYLWHWPIVVKLSYLGKFDSIIFSTFGVFLSFLLGFLSYRYVEQNFKIKTFFSGIIQNVIAVSFVSAIAAIFFFYDGVSGSLRNISLSKKAAFLEEYKSIHANLGDAYWLKCNAYKSLVETGKTDIDNTCVESRGDGGVFLWGDSHAEALSFGIRTSLPYGVPFYQVTSAGCKASLGDISQGRGKIREACTSSNRFAIAQIEKLRPTVVVLAQESMHDRTDWQKLYNTIYELGVRHVILIGPVPQWRPSLPSVYVRRHWGSDSEFIYDNAFDNSLISLNKSTVNKLRGTDIIYVDILSDLCKSSIDGKYFCRAKVNDTLLVVDYGHLSEEGSIYVVEEIIMPKLSKLLVD